MARRTEEIRARVAEGAESLMRRLESARELDRITSPISDFVNRVVPQGKFRDLLHGVPMGHPAHPVLVQIPLGAWMSAVLLDRLPGTGRSSQFLVGIGTLAAAPAAVTGIVDWAKGHESQLRVGIVHWAANTVAVGCFTASFVARVRGHSAGGKQLALVGIGVAAAGGYLGGHLAHRQALGANHVEAVAHLFPEGWHTVAVLDELPERTLARRVVSSVPVLLYRDGDDVKALADECSHLSGPLNEGELRERSGGEMCVICPWHGSEFSLVDGAVVHGPATSPQQTFRTRVTDGDVQIALAI